MSKKMFPQGVVISVLLFSFFVAPGVSRADDIFGNDVGLAVAAGIYSSNVGLPVWEAPEPRGWNDIANSSATQTPVAEKLSWINQVQESSGDILFQKISLNLPCDFEGSSASFTMSCTDGTSTLSANYNFAFVESANTKSKNQQVMVYVWGNYTANVNGVEKNGGLSGGLLSGTKKVDNSGNIISTSLSGTLYGGIDNDSTFQVKVKFTLKPT